MLRKLQTNFTIILNVSQFVQFLFLFIAKMYKIDSDSLIFIKMIKGML